MVHSLASYRLARTSHAHTYETDDNKGCTRRIGRSIYRAASRD